MKKHWYKTIVTYCPPCGAEEKVKVRVYGDKPEDLTKTWEWIERYNYCVELG